MSIGVHSLLNLRLRQSFAGRQTIVYARAWRVAPLKLFCGQISEFRRSSKEERAGKVARYDRSLGPQLSWDINADRDYAESLIKQIADCGISERAEVKAAAAKRWCAAANVEHAGEFKEPSEGVPN